MDILGSTTKINGGTPWAVNQGPQSYVFVYQYDMFVRSNLEIVFTT